MLVKIKELIEEMVADLIDICEDENRMLVPKYRQHILVNREDVDDSFENMYVIGLQTNKSGSGLQLVLSPNNDNIQKSNRLWWTAIDFNVLWGDKRFTRYVSDFLILMENIKDGYILIDKFN